jgi:DNA topoisomerase I
MGPDRLNQYRNKLRACTANKYIFAFAGLILAQTQIRHTAMIKKSSRKAKTPAKNIVLIDDPTESARASGLRYINDALPGIRRQQTHKGFRYLDPRGKPLRNAEDLRRIKSLVIPPAWNDVWISPISHSHLQATGRDAKGRKQYRYHPRWREVRDQTKYHRLLDFGRVLPRLRARVNRDLARPGLPREKVIATVVKLLETTLIRVGNEEYAQQNGSFGLTTMRNKHVKVKGANIQFVFRGKSGVKFELDVNNRRLAKIVKSCRDLPGQELFQYFDDEGTRRSIDSSDVNEYLRSVMQTDFTAKDFRTWAGTVLAATELRAIEGFDSEAQAKRNIVSAIQTVAKKLGNTRAVCRKCYVHPAVLDSYVDGSLVEILSQRAKRDLADSLNALRAEEVAVMAILERQLKTATRKKAA